jgi:hypothetical protein
MRGSINKEMYGGEIIPTVAKEIAATRKVELQNILARQKDSITVYPSAAALSDAISYHELCSIPMAMSTILARANARSSENKTDVATSLNIIDEAIAVEQSKLTDKVIVQDAVEISKIKGRIAQLSNKLSDIVRMYVIPGVATVQPDQSNPTGQAVP